MGCQQSAIHDITHADIHVSIVDPNFVKAENQSIRQVMYSKKIYYQYFISINAFIEQFNKRYTNAVIASIDNYKQINQLLLRFNLYPNIYVIQSNRSDHQQQNNKDNIIFLDSYTSLIAKIEKKVLYNNLPFPSKIQKLDAKILLKNTIQSAEQFIFKQTFKSKQINYEMYNNFQEIQQSMHEKRSAFIVTDYIYHKEVMALAQNFRIKVICFCQLTQKNYHPDLFFISNNFLEIATQIAIDRKHKMLNYVKCTQIYLYSEGINALQYAKVFQMFNFQVKTFAYIEEIAKQTIFLFAATVVVPYEQYKQIKKFTDDNQYAYKIKIVVLEKNCQPSIKSMRKIIKQCKKGYRAQKGLTRSVDLIDKYVKTQRFLQAAEELNSNEIRCHTYDNLRNYVKSKKLLSPYIICSYEQKSLLIKYLQQIKSTSKIILFCDKSNIDTQLKNNKSFVYVSHNFKKIISYLKKNFVYNPIILNQCDIEIQQNVINFTKKNQRISALIPDLNILSKVHFQNKNCLTSQFPFINISKYSTNNDINDLLYKGALIWKLEQKPFSEFDNFKKSLMKSLLQLKKIYRLNFPQNQYNKWVEDISQMTIGKLMNKSKELFEAQIGAHLNLSLRNIELLNKDEIKNLREFIFLLNLNFLSLYKFPLTKQVTLEYIYPQSKQFYKCQLGSYIFNKDYMVFAQLNNQNCCKCKLIVHMKHNIIMQKNIMINNYFKYGESYIFQPYSQFRLINRTQQEGISYIHLEIVNNMGFLENYFSLNLIPFQLLQCEFIQQIEQFQKDKSTKIINYIDQFNHQSVELNLLRMEVVKNFQQKKYDQAIKKVKQIIQNNSSLTNNNMMQYYYWLAISYYEDKQNQKAEQMINHIIKEQGDSYISTLSFNIFQQPKNAQTDNSLKISRTNKKLTFKIINDQINYIKQQSNKQISIMQQSNNSISINKQINSQQQNNENYQQVYDVDGETSSQKSQQNFEWIKVNNEEQINKIQQNIRTLKEIVMNQKTFTFIELHDNQQQRNCQKVTINNNLNKQVQLLDDCNKQN